MAAQTTIAGAGKWGAQAPATVVSAPVQAYTHKRVYPNAYARKQAYYARRRVRRHAKVLARQAARAGGAPVRAPVRVPIAQAHAGIPWAPITMVPVPVNAQAPAGTVPLTVGMPIGTVAKHVRLNVCVRIVGRVYGGYRVARLAQNGKLANLPYTHMGAYVVVQAGAHAHTVAPTAPVVPPMVRARANKPAGGLDRRTLAAVCRALNTIVKGA